MGHSIMDFNGPRPTATPMDALSLVDPDNLTLEEPPRWATALWIPMPAKTTAQPMKALSRVDPDNLS